MRQIVKKKEQFIKKYVILSQKTDSMTIMNHFL